MGDKKRWTVGSTATSEPSFDLVLRGYDRREVDSYTRYAETQLASLLTEHQDTQAQLRTLTIQLQQAQTELLELRRRPPVDDKMEFHHLGPRIEEILRLAEDQANAMRNQAIAEADAIREEAQRHLNSARSNNEQAIRDLETALAARRAEADRDITARRDAVEKEAARLGEYARRVHEHAENALGDARNEAERIKQASAVEAIHIRERATSAAQAKLAKVEEETASLAGAAELYAQQTRAAAEQHARQTRSAAEQHAQQTRASAEEAAARILEQAEEQARAVRAASEMHASRLHAATEQVRSNATREEVTEAAPNSDRRHGNAPVVAKHSGNNSRAAQNQTPQNAS